jgi:hypothetical protein
MQYHWQIWVRSASNPHRIRLLLENRLQYGWKIGSWTTPASECELSPHGVRRRKCDRRCICGGFNSTADLFPVAGILALGILLRVEAEQQSRFQCCRGIKIWTLDWVVWRGKGSGLRCLPCALFMILVLWAAKLGPCGNHNRFLERLGWLDYGLRWGIKQFKLHSEVIALGRCAS